VPAASVPLGWPLDRWGGVAVVVDWADIAERPNSAKPARATRPQMHFLLPILHSLEIPPAGECQQTEQDDHHVKTLPKNAYL
jgi:hypothetical protein